MSESFLIMLTALVAVIVTLYILNYIAFKVKYRNKEFAIYFYIDELGHVTLPQGKLGRNSIFLKPDNHNHSVLALKVKDNIYAFYLPVKFDKGLFSKKKISIDQNILFEVEVLEDEANGKLLKISPMREIYYWKEAENNFLKGKIETYLVIKECHELYEGIKTGDVISFIGSNIIDIHRVGKKGNYEVSEIGDIFVIKPIGTL